MEETIINRVANSGLITIDLEELAPKEELVVFDIKDQLWQGMALKEKDFRSFIKENNWQEYNEKHVAIYCSVDAIIPKWAYMLLTSALQPYAKSVVFGDIEELRREVWKGALDKIDINSFENKRVVVKGCSKEEIPTSIYVELSRRLLPKVLILMYGEPCSTVPIYKKPRK